MKPSDATGEVDAEAVHRYPVGLQDPSEIDGEVLEPDLGDAVRHQARDGEQGRHRRHVQDAAAPRRLEVRRRRLARHQRCGEVDRHHQLVALDGDLQVADERHRRVVHQDVEPSEVLDRPLDHRLDIVRLREIRRHRQGVATGRLDLSNRLVEGPWRPLRRVRRRTSRTGDIGSVVGQRHRDRRADTT
jgi:hypothetical protein